MFRRFSSQKGREGGGLGQRGWEHGGRDQTIVGSCQSNVRLCYRCMQPGHLIRECPESMFSGRPAPLSAGIGRGGRGNDGLRLRGQERGGRGRTVVLTPKNAEACNEMISGCDNRRPWSDLPPLVLCEIAMRLTSPFAFSALAGVCSSWRSVAKSVKSDFIASQPPLLLTLPNPSSRKLTYSLYSLVEDRSYSAESLIPAKSWQPTSASFIKFSYLGYSHGYLIMLSTSAPIDHRPGEIFTFTWDAPSLLSPLTGEIINLKHTTDCAVMFSGGLLTAPVISADCKLMLFDHRNMHCWQISDSSRYMFILPAVTNSAVVHKGRLYLASDSSRVWLLNASHPHEVLQVIQPPTEFLPVPQLPHLVELEGELLMMTYFNLVPELRWELGLKTTLRLDTYQLDLSRGELYARWMMTSGSGPLFIDSWGGRAYIGRGKMKGVEEGYVYRAERGIHDYHVLYLVNTAGRFYKSSPNDGVDRVWIHPGDLQQWF